MMKRMITGIMLVGLCLVVLGACNDKGKEKEQATSDKGKVVATVNGEGIPRAEYEEMIEDMKVTYSQQGIDVETLDKKMIEQLETQVLDQLVNTELLSQLATKEGIEVQDASVNEQFEVMKGNFESEEKYQEALERNKLTEESLKEKIKTDLLITQFLEKRVGQVKVTEDEITKAYDEYKEAMTAQEQEVETLEDFRVQLEQQVMNKKRQEKITNIIQKLRVDNDIKVL
ncbi:SurA N-terminal domain-containing protein [Bacillus sp. DJP31]|uniref:SurA N-terminal domain-containing protein n=1 Tax=Bacillus sp. DJP31 TaxID=3409789 RepID=UPI003BB63FB5